MAEKFICPACGEQSVIKEKKIYDDNFALKEIRRVCALCGAPVAQEKAAAPARSKLAALLGEDAPEKVKLSDDPDDRRFCINCRYFMLHPFKNLCGLQMKEIESTDRCDRFEEKKEEKK